ncbi:MAG: pirin family protein [Myxococcaceae bacterium]|nr:pirin family protein [Myxococcaceae bacterium]
MRALPQARRRMVGPFVFLDQMGPAEGPPMTVLPHPHIGLSTVTYLFEGEAMHRDTLGSVQRIVPGDVNWMTAGRGIAHSERGDRPARTAASGDAQASQRANDPVLAAGRAETRSFGIQIWVALPKPHEETQPTFAHHPKATLPSLDGDGASLRVVAGRFGGKTSPVKTHSELFYVVAELEAGGTIQLPADQEERAAYVVDGRVGNFNPGDLAVFKPKSDVLLRADEPSRVLLFGGATMDAPRHIWWNFVSSSKERIEQAKADWRAQKFGVIPGETEHIPLPER